MSEQIPRAISEEVVNLLGIDVRVYVLDNGKRIMDADDIERLFGLMTAEPIHDPQPLPAIGDEIKTRLNRSDPILRGIVTEVLPSESRVRFRVTHRNGIAVSGRVGDFPDPVSRPLAEIEILTPNILPD